MNVKTMVKAKSMWSRADRDLAQAVVQFCMEELGIYNYDKYLCLKLMYTFCEVDAAAAAMTDRRFIVWVTAHANKKQLIETICHEMVHVKQYIRDGLVLDDVENKAWWKGKERDWSEDTDYWRSPWEVEARRVGKKLRKRYLRT